MYARTFILTLCVCLLSFRGLSQAYTYSYTDPCTGNIKTIQVPQNGVNVTYYGQIRSFQPDDFNNGNFENWAKGVFQSFGGNNPCASLTGLPQSINIAQNTVLNTISILNSLSALSDLQGGATDVLGNVISSTTSSGNSKKEKKSNTVTTIDPVTGTTTTTTTDPSTSTVTTTSVSSNTSVSGETQTTTTDIKTTVDAPDKIITTSTSVVSTCRSDPSNGEGKSSVSSSTTIKEEPKQTNISTAQKSTGNEPNNS